jgi:hypothetical protein
MSEQDSASNIKRIVFSDQEEKAIGRGRIGRRLERFDPNAIDGDNDGTVQEGSNFERPAGPQNMPKVKPIQVPRREDVPLKPSTPSRPSTPSKPNEVPQTPKVPAQLTTTRPRRLSGSISSSARKKETSIANNVLDMLEKDQDRINNIKDLKKREDAVVNHNAVWEYAENLIDDIFDDSTTSGEFNWLAETIRDISGGMPEDVKNSARELSQAYLEREKEMVRSGRKPSPPKPQELRKRRIAGSIGSSDSNRFEADDENFGADIFSPEDLSEINDLQDSVLDELAESIIDADSLDAQLQEMIDEEQDPDGARDRSDIKAIQAWLKDHPFNSAARNYEEREWADNEADGQAERYAPIPWEAEKERSDQIDWDKMLRQANLTPRQKEDWELTDEELEAREALATEKLGPDAKAKAERAQIWSRVKGGEGFREIAPDYPDFHWTLVRDMSRLGATEAGVTKQQSQVAERAARAAAKERAMLAEVERLANKMSNAKDVKDLKRRLRLALEEAKNIRKRTSNEYQMIRKKQVERWRLAASLIETMPEQKDGEQTSDFAERLRSWFFETSPLFEQLAEDINHGHDISTATDRAYDFQNSQIQLIEDKINDTQGFWDDIQKMKNTGSGGGSTISGSIGVPRGVRIANKPKAKKVDFREFEAIQSDIAKLGNSSFEAASSLKRPSGLNKQESAIVSRMLAGKDFTKGFFKPKRKPKKA